MGSGRRPRLDVLEPVAAVQGHREERRVAVRSGAPQLPAREHGPARAHHRHEAVVRGPDAGQASREDSERVDAVVEAPLERIGEEMQFFHDELHRARGEPRRCTNGGRPRLPRG
jgi:hypothetical protein